MKIVDSCKAMRQIMDALMLEPEREHCVLAIAEQTGCDTYQIYDSCEAENVGGQGFQSQFYIPAKVSRALLNVCQKAHNIPVVIHTHSSHRDDLLSLGFSKEDMAYIEQFVKCAAHMEISNCLFIVTDGTDIVCYQQDLKSMLYTIEGGEIVE